MSFREQSWPNRSCDLISLENAALVVSSKTLFWALTSFLVLVDIISSSKSIKRWSQGDSATEMLLLLFSSAVINSLVYFHVSELDQLCDD